MPNALKLLQVPLAAALVALGAYALPSVAEDAKLSAQDREFLGKALRGSKAEVQLGKLAEERSKNEKVQEFAEKMVKDHSDAAEQLREIAQDKNAEVDDSINKSAKQEMARLKGLRGAEFDRAYMQHMVKEHKKTIDDFEKQAKSGTSDELKKFAEDTLPKLRNHLQMAQSAQTAVQTAAR